MTVVLEAVERWARERGDAVAISSVEITVTYAELTRLAERRAKLLRRGGLGAGARLAIVADDAVGALTSVLGAQALGATTMLLSPVAPRDEAARLLARFGGEAVLREGAVAAVPGAEPPDPALLGAEPALALATSGVSGAPKVAERAWTTVAAGATSLARKIGLGPEEKLLCTTPPHHAYAFVAGLIGCLLSGATYLAPPTPTPPGALAQLCERWRPSVLFSVPALYRWYLDGPALPRPPRLFVSAGEQLPQGTVQRWRGRYGRPICNHYGSTEVGMLTFEPEGIAGSAGLPLPGTRVEIAASSGPGEVFAEASGRPALMLDCGASGRCDRRAPVAFPTGDLGRLGDDGRLYLEGRLGETIDLGGQKVVPAEVEEAIRRYGPVANCAVTGQPDAEGAPRVCAFVEAGREFDARELRLRLREELAPHKVPSVIRRLDRLPRTGTGKLLRSQLPDLPQSRSDERRG
jgi:acyl-coenzyme A synthetase/AMP-(fatty) acid ligase